MFDLDGLPRRPVRTSRTQTTQLYTKIFDKKTWTKLDFPVPELGYDMTMQKYLKSKYNIVVEIREQSQIHNFSTKSLLDKSLRENKLLCKKGNELKKKFLLYAVMEGKDHLIDFIEETEFNKSSISVPKKNPRAI